MQVLFNRPLLQYQNGDALKLYAKNSPIVSSYQLLNISSYYLTGPCSSTRMKTPVSGKEYRNSQYQLLSTVQPAPAPAP